MLMVGDQIYADDLNVIGADMTLEQFFARYRVTFGQEHIQKLMARLPTYMTLDDHEIRNDWSQDEFAHDPDLYAAAMHAYQSYQLVHGPAFQPRNQDNLSDVPERLWYQFTNGRAAFFVMDTRTERFKDKSRKQMLSPEQVRALKQWMKAVPANRPKFVATSVPMFPDPRSSGDDKWKGFDKQRREILDFIRDEKIARVVFLSGDVHCSMSAQLKCSTHPGFNVTSVVSSSFFWPYPQGRASDFKLSGKLTESGGSVYTVHKTGRVHSADNFTRLTERGGQLRVQVYERKGKLLGGRVLNI
jgi:alkaline phosphatase D